MQHPAPDHHRSSRYVRVRGWASRLVVIAAGLIGTGCSGDSLPNLPKLNDLNPFVKKEPPLPGTRIAITSSTDKVVGDLAPADRPLVIAPPRSFETWTQPGGTANNAPGHIAMGAGLKQAWSADAGEGSNRRGKVTASPIVADGRIYTLDAAAGVRAFSTGGSQVWRTSLVPERRDGVEGYGGGLAYDAGRIYAATGFGDVVALDAATGKVVWQKNFGAPFRSSPTAAGDRVFVVANDGKLLCLSPVDGSELWAYRGVPGKTGIISNPSPAVADDLVIAPFTSGEVVAARIATGQVAWSENLSRTRLASGLTSLTDAARPVADNGIVYAIGHGGRMIAIRQRTGERVWGINLAGTQMPWVAGEAVYVADTNGQLAAVTQRDGKIAWTVKLPGGGTWSGPTLAGGLLWVVSSTGQLVGADPSTGRIASTLSVGSPVYIAPVAVNGRLYVLTDSARLIAYSAGS